MDGNELGAEGARHISKGLKENKTLTALKYVQPELRTKVSAPPDT